MHGHYKLKATMKQLGKRAIDGRTKAGKLRKALIQDLGGKNISAQRRLLADAITRANLLHERISESLATMSVVNRRKKTLYPAIAEVVKLTDSLARLVSLVGTEKAPALDKPQDQAEQIAQDPYATAAAVIVKLLESGAIPMDTIKQIMQPDIDTTPPEPDLAKQALRLVVKKT